MIEINFLYLFGVKSDDLMRREKILKCWKFWGIGVGEKVKREMFEINFLYLFGVKSDDLIRRGRILGSYLLE